MSDATGNLPLAIGLMLLALLAAAVLWLAGMLWVRAPGPAEVAGSGVCAG